MQPAASQRSPAPVRPIEVRATTGQDIPSFHAALDAVARERKFLLFLEAPPLDSTSAWLSGHIAKGYPAVVAVDGERVVGWCDISPFAKSGIDHIGRLGMGIVDGYRGQGLGAKLLDAALDAAWSMGLERVELEVFASNARAIRLYTRMGFEHEGVKRRGRKIDGGYEDILMMAKLKPEM